MGSHGGVNAPDRRACVTLAACLTVLAARVGHGAQPGYEISLGVAESDNVAQVPSGTKSGTIVTEGVDFSWHDLRPRLEADIDANLNYLEYLQHVEGVKDEVIGNFLGQGRFALVPDLLFWNASDNFGQGLVDPLAADNPANRENINYARTGPELLLPLGATTFVDVKANYGRVTYETSPLDSQRFDGGLGLVRRISQDSSVSLNVRDERINFSNDSLNPDYSRQDAFAHYEFKDKRTTVDLDLGYSRLRDPVFPGSGVLARFDISRRVSPSSTVALALGRQYSDAGDAFRLGQTLGGSGNPSSQTVQQSGEPFTSTYASLSWNFQRSRTDFGISADYYKDAYPQPSTLDDNREELAAHVSRKLTPTLQVSLHEQYLRQQFNDIVGNSSESITGLQLAWQSSEHLRVLLDAQRAQRHSDLPGTAFAENRFWIRIAYGRQAQRPVGPPTPLLPGQLLR